MLITRNVKILNSYLKYHDIEFAYFDYINNIMYICYQDKNGKKKYYIEQKKNRKRKIRLCNI